MPVSDCLFTIRLLDLDRCDLGEMPEEARRDGFLFIDRLVEEWTSGANRFRDAGETFCGLYDGDELLAVGGINRDPYAGSAEVGRIRHFYVRRSRRRHGVGRKLLTHLLRQALGRFALIRLRTTSEAASCFYEAVGFHRFKGPDATHFINLAEYALKHGEKHQGEIS